MVHVIVPDHLGAHETFGRELSPVSIKMRAVIKDGEAKDDVTVPGDGRAMLAISIGISRTWTVSVGIDPIWDDEGWGSHPFVGGETIRGMSVVEKGINVGEQWGESRFPWWKRAKGAKASYRNVVETVDGLIGG